MNLSPQWVEYFRLSSIEAVHWSEVGTGKESDSEIMKFARINNFILLTHDLDFGSLLAHSNEKGPSVIQVRIHNIVPDHFGKELVEILNQAEENLTKGALIIVDEKKRRMRMLPLKK
jgi:predicted nuclease of predicted toxin-antitoxin system